MRKARLTKRESYARRMARQSAKTEALFPDEPPKDMDQFRLMLARKIAMFIGNRQRYWCGCKEPACRRQRACLAPHIHCSNAPPRPPSTPEDTARAMAQVQRTLRDVQARREEAE